MTDKFLRAKHWQLFLLLFGVPMLFQFVIMTSMISNIEASGSPNPAMMFDQMKFFPLIMVVYMAVFFSWFWSMAIGLQAKVPEGVKMKVKKFKIFFFIPLCYMTLIMFFMGFVFNGIADGTEDPSGALFGGLVMIIFPLHLLSMFCMFYILYFAAKTVKTVELQREVKFSEFAGEFFLLWFYPIGVWIVQPKINKMIEE